MNMPKKEKTGFTELEDKYWRALRLIQTHVNEPDVVKSIVDKAIGAEEDVIPIEEPEDSEFPLPKLMNNPEVNSLLGEWTPDNTEDLYTEEDMRKHFEVPRAGSPEHLALIEKQNPGTLEKWLSNKMKKDAERLRGSDSHFGEEQAEGLDNLLEGLRDTPHDNRW